MPMKRIRNVGSGLNGGVQHIGGGVLLVVCLLASVADVGNRFLVGKSLPWSHQISIWAVIASCFIITGLITWEHSQINASFFFQRLKGLAKKITNQTNLASELIFCGLALYGGIRNVSLLMQRGTSVTLGMWTVPWWPIMLSCVTIGLFIAILYIIATFVHDLKIPAETSKSTESERAS